MEGLQCLRACPMQTITLDGSCSLDSDCALCELLRLFLKTWDDLTGPERESVLKQMKFQAFDMHPRSLRRAPLSLRSSRAER